MMKIFNFGQPWDRALAVIFVALFAGLLLLDTWIL